MRLGELGPYLLADARVLGDPTSEIRALRALGASFGPNEMTYVTASRVTNAEMLSEHPASTFITDYDPGPAIGGKSFIVTPRPRLQMAKLTHLFARPTQDFDESGARPNISSTAKVHPRAFLSSEVTVGAGTVIHANVTIYRNVVIGSECVIHSGTVIGAEGFGYEPDEDGRWFPIAHLGGVTIGDGVHIGANTCIDRGTLGDTVIAAGARIDNLVHVAHNVRIGRNAMVIANVMLGGSSVVGDDAYVAPSATIREGRILGARSFVGLGSVVVKDVPDGVTVMGVPARPRQ